MIAIGPERFGEMLAGFHAIDEHFLETPLEQNLPALMGLLNVWYAELFGSQTVGVFPYEQYLERFPAYLQQLTMESNGKHVRLDGDARRLRDRPDLLGRAGDERPAQLLPADPPGNAPDPVPTSSSSPSSLNPLGDHHDLLAANVFAQAEALAFGKTAEEVRAEGVEERLVPHKTFEGNRPTSLLMAEQLDPATLGKLVALYEHSRLHPGDDLGDRLLRPVGRRAGQEARGEHHPRARVAPTSRSWHTTARRTR